ncbi:hypothetical protein OG196_00640 [Kitasatospora purpeofusca]|uniref:hypothetical protein n=1 Tax=Kitasatospora purpeofusca TaxID=67352 RepID=UPI002E12591B|nr:hypothetical protein OG196_00640 [Kitasatospora purpeofusca]
MATFGSTWAVLAVGHNAADHVFGQSDHQAAGSATGFLPLVERGPAPAGGGFPWAAIVPAVGPCRACGQRADQAGQSAVWNVSTTTVPPSVSCRSRETAQHAASSAGITGTTRGVLTANLLDGHPESTGMGMEATTVAAFGHAVTLPAPNPSTPMPTP